MLKNDDGKAAIRNAWRRLTAMRYGQVCKALAFLLAFGRTGLAGAYADEIPSVLWYPYQNQSKAAWVSLERAVLPNGGIDWELFGDLQAAPLKIGMEARKGSDCVSVGSLTKHPLNFTTANDLRSLVRNSLGIYRGTIVASGPGFADGDPATLLAVRVEKTIKPSSEIATDGLLYVAYPVAEFSVNGQRICKSDERLPEVPKVGDGILVFPLNDPLNEEKNLIYPYFQEVMVQRRDGKVALPDKWSKDVALENASSLDEIEARVRSFAAQALPQSRSKP
jgi:hypothetical protein